MTEKKKNIIAYLDTRIEFYRRGMIAIFVFGLLAGMSILCGKSLFPPIKLFNQHQLCTNILLCLSVALTGITTGSAYRRQIRYLKERRSRILLYSDDSLTAPKSSLDRIIAEIQALFALLFVLTAVICFVDYPIPELPGLSDKPFLRLLFVIGFILVCLISVRLEGKHSTPTLNPVQDFIRRHQNQARIRYDRPNLPGVNWVPESDFHDQNATKAHTHQ